ncbi:hypothetical protein MNEG_9098, partial [Monoraphidium neglectum]
MGLCHSTEQLGVPGRSCGGGGGSSAVGPELPTRRQRRRTGRDPAAADGAAAATRVLCCSRFLAPRTASKGQSVAAFVELLDLSEAPTTPEVDNILSLATGIFGAHTAVLALFNDKRVRRAGDGRLGTAVAARAAPALP